MVHIKLNERIPEKCANEQILSAKLTSLTGNKLSKLVNVTMAQRHSGTDQTKVQFVLMWR